MTKFQFFLNGGFLRDFFLGVESKDVDFTVVATECEGDAFEDMVAHLKGENFKMHQLKPEFLTVRAGVPEGHPLRAQTRDADFVLARDDGPTADGRRPQFVKPGTLLQDLARRDFTVNAMAQGEDGELVDPFGGLADLEARVLRAVGDPAERFREDFLRVVRGLRFMVTKGLKAEAATFAAMLTDEVAEGLATLPKERLSGELDKMFAFDTLATLQLLATLPEAMQAALFPEGLRLVTTMKG